MKIFIDADGCPVVDITLEIAEKYGLDVSIICDTAHEFRHKNARVITVDKGADSADFKLVNMLEKGDIAVTQDYGLAAMCLSKKAYAINQNGLVYTDENIDGLLMQRYVTKKLKNSGGRIKGPKKRTDEMNEQFRRALEDLLTKLVGEEGK